MITDKITLLPLEIAEGKTRFDLVKGWKTKARFVAIEWIWNFDTGNNARIVAAINIMDSDTQEPTATIGARELYGDRYNISRVSVMAELNTQGGNALSGRVWHDLRGLDIDIVCPCSGLSYHISGSGALHANIWYQIMHASSDEIVDIAAKQGLQMEV